MSRMRATPPSTHFAAGCFVRSCAANTKYGRRPGVQYVGQMYTPFSLSVAGPALQLMTGLRQNISFGLDSSSVPPFGSQRAPSRNIPSTYAPSREALSTWALSRFVTSVNTCSLSSSSICSWQDFCFTAVRYDCGLKSFETSTTFGMFVGSPHHSSSCAHRSERLVIHVASGRVDGKASFAQYGGIFSM